MWSPECQKPFDKVKSLLASQPVLLHFDTSKPVVVECDASPYVVGACLSQQGPSGALQPMCFISRSLTTPEHNYIHIEKEALAIVFEVKRLHQYLYSHSFTLRADHKPLLKIFGAKDHLPTVTTARLQHWAVLLSAYTYAIEYLQGSSSIIADCL